MDVARTSMIHAAAPHFLWPFAVQYAAHQINLQPRVSLTETTPTLWWTGKVGDASVFRVWGSRAFVCDASADKLSSRAVPCVFLAPPPLTQPGGSFTTPPRVVLCPLRTSRLTSRYLTTVSFPTALPLSPPATLPRTRCSSGRPPLPSGSCPSGVSQVDPVEPVEVAVDSGAARDRAQRTITLTQSHMVQQVFQRFGFTYSSPRSTPLPTSHSLSSPPSDESVEPSGFCPELVGCLMVLRYLCTTLGMGLVLGGRARVVLTGHADASWSTRSSSVLCSSCEAEIYAGAMAAQELRWLTYLQTDLGEAPRSPPVLMCGDVVIHPELAFPFLTGLVTSCFLLVPTCLLVQLFFRSYFDMPYLFPELSAFATFDEIITHLRTSDTRYRAALPTKFLDKNPPPMYITLYFIVTRLPDSLSVVSDLFLTMDPTDFTVDLLEKHLLAAEASIVAVGAVRGTSCVRD
ncbi:unnamed protein product [Closterium sp. NIES-54]